MKILIVSGFFFPEVTPRAFRTTELAKELSRTGNDVTVCAPLDKTCNYDSLLQQYPMRLIDMKKDWQFLRNVNNKFLNLGVRAINRSLNLFFDYPTIEFKYKGRKILKSLKKEHFDLVISIAQPHSVHWGVNDFIKNNPGFSDCWIADCGDPYMGCKTDSFKKPFYFKYIEKSFCSNCNYIAVPIEEAIPSYYPEFHDKIKIIPQGFDISKELSEAPKDVNNDVPTFIFAGSFIPGMRDPRPLLEWLSKSNRDFRFHIFTGNFALVEGFKEKLGNRLVLHKYVPRNELLDFMKGCDFLINLENGTAVQSPSKLIDYSLCRRPVLSIDSNNMNYSMIEEFLNGDYHRQLPPLDLSKYDIRNVAKQFTDLLKK